MKRSKLSIALAATIATLSLGALTLAQQTDDQKISKAQTDPAQLRLRYMFNQYKDSAGITTSAPGLNTDLSVPLGPRWRIEANYYGGDGNKGPRAANLHSIQLGGAYRLDDPNISGDGFFEHIYVTGAWQVFESVVTDNNGRVLEDRDEGLGLGISRMAAPDRPVSYYYRLTLFPTVVAGTTNTIGQKAFLAEAGLQVRVVEHVNIDLGYRFHSHKHAFKPERQSFESGPTLGFSARF
jgi:hypothetical protein